MKQKAYAAAGVDIDLGNKVKATLPQLLASTHRREVLGKVGGFGGLFALDVKKYREPLLVSCASVTRYFLERCVAGDGRNFLFSASGLCKTDLGRRHCPSNQMGVRYGRGRAC